MGCGRSTLATSGNVGPLCYNTTPVFYSNLYNTTIADIGPTSYITIASDNKTLTFTTSECYIKNSSNQLNLIISKTNYTYQYPPDSNGMSVTEEPTSLIIGRQTMSNNTIVNYINSNGFTDGIYVFTVSSTETPILATSNINYMTSIQYTASNNTTSNISIKTLKTPIILSNSVSKGYESFTNQVQGYMTPNPLVGIDYHNF